MHEGVNAVIDRHAAAENEDSHGAHESEDVAVRTVAVVESRIGGTQTASHPKVEQPLIRGIGKRVNRLREHGAGARNHERDELEHGEYPIADEGHEDCPFACACHTAFLPHLAPSLAPMGNYLGDSLGLALSGAPGRRLGCSIVGSLPLLQNLSHRAPTGDRGFLVLRILSSQKS